MTEGYAPSARIRVFLCHSCCAVSTSEKNAMDFQEGERVGELFGTWDRPTVHFAEAESSAASCT